MAESLLKPLANIYESETVRQNTFIFLNWPKHAPVWPILLAKAGFYFQGKDMDVICFSCGLKTSVNDWIRNIHPQQMHFKLNPDCEFIKFLLKPEGGPATFNDENKWDLSRQNENEDNTSQKGKKPEKPDITMESFTLNNHQGSSNISSYQYNSQNTVISQDSGLPTMSTETSYGFPVMSTETPHGLQTMLPETSSGLPMSTETSSGLPTWSAETSSVAMDSGPVGSLMSRDSLLVSGKSLITPFLYQSNAGFSSTSNFTPTTAAATSSVSTLDPFTPATTTAASSVSTLDSGLPQSITRPDNVRYKHPDMETVSARMGTYDTWPHFHIQPPRVLVTAGFYYTLEQDIVRCFCCDLGLSEWDAQDDAWLEHAKHSPNCWYLKRVKGQQYINEIQQNWKKIYSPKFPNLIDEVDRIRTFNNWPNLINTPTGTDIAKAGFFYTGEGRGDECRCHYCDGGLQHWENGDNPWEQHAYYFPFCKFVIKMKGRQFISEVRERFEARGPQVDALIRESEELEAAQNRDDVRDRKIREVLSKEEFKFIFHVGYSKKALKMASEELFREKGDFNFTPEQVLNKILDIQDRGDELPVDDDDDETEEEPQAKPILPADEFLKTLDKKEPVGDAVEVLEENRKLKQSMICWKCKKEHICILFTPCGHRLTCENCSKSVHHCMKCNKKVKKKYKTYLA